MRNQEEYHRQIIEVTVSDLEQNIKDNQLRLNRDVAELNSFLSRGKFNACYIANITSVLCQITADVSKLEAIKENQRIEKSMQDFAA